MRTKSFAALIFVLGTILAWTGPAQATVITFDSEGGAEGSSVGPIGDVTFTNAIFADPGGTLNFAFGTPAPLTADNLFPGAPVGGRFITDRADLFPNGDPKDAGAIAAPIEIEFAGMGVMNVSFYILDVDWSGTEVYTLTIENSGGVVDEITLSELSTTVGSPATVGSTIGDALATLVDFNNTTAITKLTIAGTNSDPANNGRYGFGIDNLSYGVPEPGTLALLGIGLLGLGFLHRRRARI